jgi:hypothetical protein
MSYPSDTREESQIFITAPGGSTLVVDVEASKTTVSQIISVVSTRTGIPESSLCLRPFKGPALDIKTILPVDVFTFEAALQGGLAGGKGGFGAMLRALAKQNTGHKTVDFGACRDLNGRRLRHVNNDLKLKKWQEAQERKVRSTSKDPLSSSHPILID